MTRRFILCALVAAAASAADSKKKGKGNPGGEEFSVVGGTVFKDPGFALPDAEVTLEAVSDSPGAKVKKLKTATSPRGEFTFRVPPSAAKYKVAVSVKGFKGAEKTVEVQGGGERVDATFSLSPESK